VTVRVDDLPPCSACGGKVFPLVLCESCGSVTIFRDVRSLGWTAPCPECGTPNSWELICDQCRTQFPPPGRPESQLTKSPPAQTPVEIGAVPVGRPRRRIKGEVDSRALTDLLSVLGLDASRARALIDRGYDAPWKIARAKEDQLARIPEVGPIAARKMVASFHLLNYAPPKQTKESIAQAEYECPLCQCVTSAFSSTCVECGAPFDEEEMEEDIRHAFAGEGPAALRLFYDGCLAEKPDDAELWYARGLLLESLGQSDEAIASLERASSKAPDSKKIKVAKLRLQAKHLQRPEDGARLRSTASSLLDDVAWDQEVAQLDRVISEAERECPQCGATVPAEMAMCPSCGARLSIPKPVPPPQRTPPEARAPRVREGERHRERKGPRARAREWSGVDERIGERSRTDQRTGERDGTRERSHRPRGPRQRPRHGAGPGERTRHRPGTSQRHHHRRIGRSSHVPRLTPSLSFAPRSISHDRLRHPRGDSNCRALVHPTFGAVGPHYDRRIFR